MRVYVAGVAAAAFTLSSCAAMFSGTSDNLTITSETKGAEIFVNDQFVGTGSGTYRAPKNQSHIITVRKEGCDDQQIAVNKEFDPLTLLGVFIDFGIVSILIVDGAATGAWRKASQTVYRARLNCAADTTTG